MSKPSCIALAVFGVPIALLVIFRAQGTHGHPVFVVKVNGQLLRADRGSRPARALVMAMQFGEWATDERMMRLVRERAHEWKRSRERFPNEVLHPPQQANGATGGEDGRFSIDFGARWTVSYLWGMRLTDWTPPARYGLTTLRIEIEGRDPIILDMPEGTWTEHDGEDGPWATWDLGVVEVPRRP